MSEETKSYIDKVAKELMMASHQSRDKEVSGLFREIKGDIKNMKSDLERVELAVIKLQAAYEDNVLPNMKTWNQTSENQNKVVWLIISGFVALLLGVAGFVA